jgi:mannan endo-1,4-beta-mannosidase
MGLSALRRAILLALATVLLMAGTHVFPAGARAAEPRLTFGAYVDPWHLADWRAARITPQYVARFEAFSRGVDVDGFLRETERQGRGAVLITWEPWKPVSPDLGVEAQFAPQPGYTNREIADGVQDEYITRFARNLATFRGQVYIRYAHEMNGTWYPWSRDPIQYRRAWRHVVRLFEAAGAANVKFVWSPNPSLFLSASAWRRSVRVYWPGSRYVDAVGSTMINFGGTKNYPVARFTPRLRVLHKLYRKPVMLTEVKTAKRGRVTWLRDLRRLLRDSPWIRSVAWFQSQSRAAEQLDGLGAGTWDLTHDAAAAAIVRGIIHDGRR